MQAKIEITTTEAEDMIAALSLAIAATRKDLAYCETRGAKSKSKELSSKLDRFERLSAFVGSFIENN